MPESNDSSIVSGISQHPKWLTKEYLKDKLKTYYKDQSLEITSIQFFPATGKGDNYASVLTRVSIGIQKCGGREFKQRSLIVKSSFEGDEFINEYAFNTEINFYQHIIPKIKRVLEEINDTEKIYPETIHVDSDNHAIIFEDLKEENYSMYDRTKGLPMEHAKMCLKKVAKMHAATAVLNERDPGIFKKYNLGLFNRHDNPISPIFEGLLDACERTVSQWEGFKEYGDKLKAIKPKLLEYTYQVFDPVDNHLNVLNHGDLWTNNILFNFDENKRPKDLILLDFQFTCWGSPAIDLHHFFKTSLKEEIRSHQQDELLQFYYNILSRMLNDLGFKSKIPSLQNFLLQVMEKSFFAFVSACLIQPVMVNDRNDDADIGALLGNDERSINFKNTIFQNDKVQKNLKRLLPYFDRQGLLDIRD